MTFEKQLIYRGVSKELNLIKMYSHQGTVLEKMLTRCGKDSPIPIIMAVDAIAAGTLAHRVSLLEGQSQGHKAIFKGLKMTFRIKIYGNNYTMLICIKNTTNFF